MNTTDFGLWAAQASKDIGVDQTLGDLQYARLEDLPDAALQYIKDNPTQAAFYVFNGVAFFAPGAIYGPFLLALGFHHGVAAGELISRIRGSGNKLTGSTGTVASFLQSTFAGFVPRHGWFAHLTSASMGGYGVGVLDSITRIGSVVAGVVNQIALRQNGTALHEELKCAEWLSGER